MKNSVTDGSDEVLSLGIAEFLDFAYHVVF
jgi:hypothetical protein